MTQEEKAKRYDEALEKAKSWYIDAQIDFKKSLENLFPELKESEDERIRKEIMDFIDTNTIDSDERRDRWFSYLEKYKPISFTSLEDTEVKMSLMQYISELNQDVVHLHPGIETCNEWIAWLDKQGEKKSVDDLTQQEAMDIAVAKCFEQGEQKSTDKVEPKFKERDWVVCEAAPKFTGFKTGDVVQINDKETLKLFLMFEDCFRLWNITKDAKDGDVLSFNDGHGNDSIELIKSITGKKIEFWFCLTNGNYYEVFDEITPYTNLVSRKDATPATKEQRDLLFRKMNEAGYEWDAEKKELKKIEQNPAWSEEDEKHYQGCLNLMKLSLDTKPYPYYNDYLWLKSLKDKYTWRPSDEQMEALKGVQDGVFRLGILESLYNDLKKLREE